MRIAIIPLLLAITFSTLTSQAAPPKDSPSLFAQENLIAWCVVPFDAKRRGPAQRAEMLQRLGFKKFAYDWRPEHVPIFDAEIEALKKAKIELTAWWFPPALNEDAVKILATLKRHEVKTQLWIAIDADPAPQSNEQREKVAAAVKTLRPIVEAAAAQGCSIGLYNHGGWFGDPENQLAIIAALDAPNVGIVYNLHHGHDHLDRFESLLEKMKRRLYAITLNGTDRNGERRGRKILPIGQGELDLELLRTIKESGYNGPLAILGHTQDDAELRLQDNLDGLAWLVNQLQGKPPANPPTPRTPVPREGEAPAEPIRRPPSS
jgi:sugar phosphate isomerase/epimerase